MALAKLRRPYRRLSPVVAQWLMVSRVEHIDLNQRIDDFS